MENVARLEDRRIDVRPQQAILIEAESASLNALESGSNAIAAFVSFVRATGLSVVHPRVRELLGRIPNITSHAANLSSELSDCHRIAGGIVKSNKDILMSGGIPKEDNTPPFWREG